MPRRPTLRQLLDAQHRQLMEWVQRAYDAEERLRQLGEERRPGAPFPADTITEPSFTTSRLRVWEWRGVPDPGCHMPHTMYAACLSDGKIDWPGILASCSVFVSPMGATVDWLEIVPLFRRQGFGTELLKAICGRVGRLEIGGATKEGTAFCAAFRPWMDAKHPAAVEVASA